MREFASQNPSAAEIERALAEVFARPEFSPREPSLMARLLGRVATWLKELFPDFAITETHAQVVWWVVSGVIVVAAALLGVRLARGVRGWWRGRGLAEGEVVESVVGVVGATPVAEWEAAAAGAAAAGRWREAVLALYQVLLLRLDAAGALRYDPAKTPGDYRREVRRDAAAGGILRTFLSSFEPVAFGGHLADAEIFERLRAATARAGGVGQP